MIADKVIYVSENHAYLDETYPTVETNNRLLEEGFRYSVDGEFKYAGGMDKDGLPVIVYKVHFFKLKEDAESYALTQRHPFVSGATVPVKKVEHRKTMDEYEAEIQQEKEKKAAKQLERDTDLANVLGIPVEEVKRIQRLRRSIKRRNTEIANKRTAASRLLIQADEIEKGKGPLLKELKELYDRCVVPYESAIEKMRERKDNKKNKVR